MMRKPCILEFKKIGEPAIGYISVAEAQAQIPFKVERIFWTYFTPESVQRGRHAHYKTEQILIAAAGKIVVKTEMPNGEKQEFVLEKPNQGVYLPPFCWHTMEYSHTAVQLVFASTVYNEEDYIRSYSTFQNLKINEE